MFALSKIFWAYASPGSLLAFLLAAGLVMAATKKFAGLGRGVCAFVSVCLLAIALLPVGEWALTPLENNFSFQAIDHVDGIIVIGGDEQVRITQARGQLTAFESLRRFFTVNELAKSYLDAKIIFAGGSAFHRPEGDEHEADIARDMMTEIGVPPERMVFETQSRNTYENAVFSAQIVKPEPQQKWLLVTSAWHMTRAMGCFRAAGWDVYAAPAGYFTTGIYDTHSVLQFDQQMHLLSQAIHEYVGLVAYYLMGRTNALWPE